LKQAREAPDSLLNPAPYPDNVLNPHGTPDYWLYLSAPPVFTSPAAFTVLENQTAVATLAAGAGVTFTKSGGADAAKFNLTSGGVLTFATVPNFEAPGDADADNVYLVQVTATNADGSAQQAISVTVSDVVEVPPTLNLDFTTALDPKVTFTRGSTATYTNAAGTMVTASSGAPRFDYHPVTHVARGLLIEEQRINYVRYSTNVVPATAWWTAGSVTVTANAAVAPDGTTTAALVTGIGGVNAYEYQSIATPLPAIAHTYSIYVKKGTAGFAFLRLQDAALTKAWFNLTIGMVGTVESPITAAGIENVGNGWFRIWATKVFTAGSALFVFALTDADNNDNLTAGATGYFWGAQAEAGTFPTSFIPTVAVEVTRAADSALITGASFSSWWNASAGTFVVRGEHAASTTHPLAVADDGTANEQIRIYGSGTDPKATVVDGGVIQADIDAGTIVVNTAHKLGLAFAVNDFAVSVNGGAVATATAGTLPTPNQLRLGSNQAGNYLNGRLAAVQFYNVRKPNGELQALTT
jgi:hypothetical protein